MQADNILKWVATFTLFAGTAFNSLGYYPLGPLLLLLGGVMWLAVSIIWREPALIATNAVMTVVAIAGMCYRAFCG